RRVLRPGPHAHLSPVRGGVLPAGRTPRLRHQHQQLRTVRGRAAVAAGALAPGVPGGLPGGLDDQHGPDTSAEGTAVTMSDGVFADVVGQPAAVAVCRAAVAASRARGVSGADDGPDAATPSAAMTHAWLFTGPPGS